LNLFSLPVNQLDFQTTSEIGPAVYPAAEVNENMQQLPDTPSLSKPESSRINGAHSHGPSSEQGKLNSANARLKHGAYSKRILMDGESAEGYELFKSTFINLFLPIDAFEAECVESMVTARWRIRRLEATEASNLNIALDSNKEKVAEKFEAIDALHERAIAVSDQMSSIDANTRVQERLHRIYDRNFKLLSNYRKQSGRKVPSPLSGDPVIQTTSSAPQPPIGDAPESTTAVLTDDPTENTASVQVAASLVSKVAMFLVIFVLSFLTPAPSSAKSRNSAGQPASFDSCRPAYVSFLGPKGSIK
jgi:hypothetical protein